MRGSARHSGSAGRRELLSTVGGQSATSRRHVDRADDDGGRVGYGDEELLTTPLYPISPTPAYGREAASLSLEILDYGDEEWDEAEGRRSEQRVGGGGVRAASSSSSSLSSLGRFRAGSNRGTRRVNGGGAGHLEVLESEPFQLQEHFIDNEDSDESHDHQESRKKINSTALQGHSVHIQGHPAAAAVVPGDSDRDRAGFITKAANSTEGAETKKNAGGGTSQRHSLQEQLQSERDAFGTYQYDDHGVTVNSDEENDIVQKIRHEITKQLRNDMKEELEVFHRNDGNGEGKLEEEENEMPQELKEAIVTMRKYDRILRRKIEREKEVKRQRIQLQKRLREELADIEREARASGRGKESRDVRVNADRFLSLAAPPPAEWTDSAEEAGHGSRTATGSVTPVFATQPPDSMSAGVRRDQHDRGGDLSARSNLSESRTSIEGSTSDSHHGHKDSKQRTKNGVYRQEGGGRAGEKRAGKDFVKRNIELAADAGNFVAMTDDEKRRLEALLVDLDQVSDDPLSAARSSSLKDGQASRGISYLNDSSSHESSRNDSSAQHPSKDGRSGGSGGFSYETRDADRMADIDRRLQELMAPETWRAITTVPYSDTASSYGSSADGARETTEGESQLAADTLKFFTRTHWGLERDLDAIGEPALKDTHAEREARQRLQQIESRLAELAAAPALDVEMEAPRLSADQLQSLLEQCVRTLSLASHNAIISGNTTGNVAYPLSLAAGHGRSGFASNLAGSESQEGGDGSPLSRLSSEHGGSVLSEAVVSATDGGENSSSWSLILDNPPPPLPRETLNYLLEQARREGVGTVSPSSLGDDSQFNADEREMSDDNRSEIVDGNRSAASTRRSADEGRRHAFSRLVGRQQEHPTAAFPVADARTTSAMSEYGGRESQQSASDQYRLPPLRVSASDSPFLVQRYA